MIYLHATLQLLQGKATEFNDLLANGIAPSVGKYGMKLVGSWENVVGNRDEVIDIWQLDSIEQYEAFTRETRGMSSPLVIGETTKLIRPLPCSPLR